MDGRDPVVGRIKRDAMILFRDLIIHVSNVDRPFYMNRCLDT